RFFTAPARSFLKARFGIDLREFDDTLPEDEPLGLNQLEKYRIRQDLLKERVDTGKVDLRVFTARGVVPPGGLGELQLRSLDHDAATFHSKVMRYIVDGKKSESLPIDLALGEFSLTGRIESIYSGNIVHYRCANITVGDRLRAWVEHLARSASGERNNFKTFLIGQDEIISWKWVATAKDILVQLCKLYWDGLQSSVPLFPRTGFALVQAERSGAANPFKSARKEWNGNFAKDDGEKHDPAIEKLFPSIDPLTKESTALARKVFGPLCQYVIDSRRG